jgi:hypothetical protein
VGDNSDLIRDGIVAACILTRPVIKRVKSGQLQGSYKWRWA